MKLHECDPIGAAIVVRTLTDVTGSLGRHATAHREEERLYRESIVSTLEGCGLAVATLTDESVRRDAIERLGDMAFIDATLTRLSRMFAHHGARPRSTHRSQHGSGCRATP